MHCATESKTKLHDEEWERLKEAEYLNAGMSHLFIVYMRPHTPQDLQERQAICALRGERAAFEQSIPRLVVVG